MFYALETEFLQPHTGVWEMATEVILVDPWSSEIRIYGEVAISMVRNHSTMVKFKSAGDSEYLKVVTRIAECLELIKKLSMLKPIFADTRQEMYTVQAQPLNH